MEEKWREGGRRAEERAKMYEEDKESEEDSAGESRWYWAS
jgi:hypothetical protein